MRDKQGIIDPMYEERPSNLISPTTKFNKSTEGSDENNTHENFLP